MAARPGDPSESTPFQGDLTRAGYADNGQPGERSIYHRGYHGAFVLKPDEYRIELIDRSGK
jgi:hypothetical protein